MFPLFSNREFPPNAEYMGANLFTHSMVAVLSGFIKLKNGHTAFAESSSPPAKRAAAVQDALIAVIEQESSGRHHCYCC